MRQAVTVRPSRTPGVMEPCLSIHIQWSNSQTAVRYHCVHLRGLAICLFVLFAETRLGPPLFRPYCTPFAAYTTPEHRFRTLSNIRSYKSHIIL